MKLGTTSHPKFMRLKKLLGKPQYAVVGLLESIWMLASQCAAEDGDLSRFTPDDIAAYCEFEGPADQMLESLVASRWIDRVDNRIVIHDWVDHRPSYIEDRIRKRSERDRKNKDAPGLFDSVQDSPGQFRTIAPNPTQPNQTQPSQINSNPTIPNQDSRLGQSVGQSVSELDFLNWDWGGDEIREDDLKFCSVPRYKLVPPEQIAELIGFGRAVGQGFFGDLCASLRSQKVHSPRKYIIGAIKKHCEEQGLDHAAVMNRIREHLRALERKD